MTMEQFRAKAERTFVVRLNSPNKQWPTGHSPDLTVDAGSVEDAIEQALRDPNWLPGQTMRETQGEMMVKVTGRVLDYRGHWHKAGATVFSKNGVIRFETARR